MANQKNNSNFFSNVSEITNQYYKDRFYKYINEKSDILDFGCGSGKLLSLINCNYKIGVENNKFSQKKLKKQNLNYTSRIEQIKKKFDTIFALSVIDHLQNPSESLGKLKNKLKKNGYIIIIIRHDNLKQDFSNSSYREHLYSWSLLSFNNLLNKIGLKVYEKGIIKITLPPKFMALKKIFGANFLLFISKIYFYINLRDKRLYFICKKK
tara:strand:+ start:415 stop:1044 length:630 start_codon:yes stop_codon:yes gene_type:complete